MISDTFVVFQSALDLSRFPAPLVVKDVSEFAEVTLVEFDTAASTVRDIRLATKVGVDITCRGVVSVDR